MSWRPILAALRATLWGLVIVLGLAALLALAWYRP